MPRIRVDIGSVVSLVGTLLRWFALTLMIPGVTALVYGESPASFLITFGVIFTIGVVFERASKDPELNLREGFLVVSLSWISVTMLGALPYLLEGHGTVASPLNAFFESMSGFTTTGSTVMASINFDTHTRALLLWRQLTQWLGGMGIVVLAVAVLPRLSVGGAQLMQAEAPGPGLEKLTPHIAQTARYLWIFYVGFTALEIFLLYGTHLAGLAPEMTLYQSICHGFTTMPTGGFSPQARSIEAFQPIIQWIIIPFMVIAGTNFALIWYATTDHFSQFLENTEWRHYATVLVGASLTLTAFLLFPLNASDPKSILYEMEHQLRHGVFQMVSLITTTGYASTDYVFWAPGTQVLLLGAMFVGGCAGSTGGSVKIVRWVVVLKALWRELFTTIHTSAVRPLRLGDHVLNPDAVRGIFVFVLLYLLLFAGGAGVLLIDGHVHGSNLTAMEAIGTSATAIGNVGPGFGDVGPMNNFTAIPPVTRFVMIILMLVGRLEIITFLVLLTPAYWVS